MSLKKIEKMLKCSFVNFYYEAVTPQHLPGDHEKAAY